MLDSVFANLSAKKKQTKANTKRLFKKCLNLYLVAKHLKKKLIPIKKESDLLGFNSVSLIGLYFKNKIINFLTNEEVFDNKLKI